MEEEKKEDKIEHLDDTIKENKNLDTSEEETDKLGIAKPKDGIEEGGEKFQSNFKPDEKLEKWTKEFLQEELKNAVHEIKKDFLIIFGLFASFVTFISINVQIFKNNDNTFELIGICSISLSFIIFFALIINEIVKDKVEWRDLRKPTYIINLGFLVMGIIFLSIGNSKNGEAIKQFEKKIVEDSVQINSLQKDIKNFNDKITRTDSTIIKFQTKIQEIQELKNLQNENPQKP